MYNSFTVHVYLDGLHYSSDYRIVQCPFRNWNESTRWAEMNSWIARPWSRSLFKEWELYIFFLLNPKPYVEWAWYWFLLYTRFTGTCIIVPTRTVSIERSFHIYFTSNPVVYFSISPSSLSSVFIQYPLRLGVLSHMHTWTHTHIHSKALFTLVSRWGFLLRNKRSGPHWRLCWLMYSIIL